MNLSTEELLNLVTRVFKPRSEDKALAFLIDFPDEAVPDDANWADRRALALDWYEKLHPVAEKLGLEKVSLFGYRNARANNADLPGEASPLTSLPKSADELPEAVSLESIFKEYQILIVPSRFSATAPMKVGARKFGFRAATMPGFTRAMIPALALDYEMINRRVHQLKGLVDELESKGYNVIAQASNGLEALELIIEKSPDIVVLDIQMPRLTGIEVIAKAREAGSSPRFILLTSYKEEGLVYKAQQLGISGYLLKEEPFSEMQKCLQKVSAGGTYFSRTFEQLVEEGINPQLQRLKLLSSSERTILRMMAQSKTSKEIAEELVISLRTVQKHRSNMIQKLALESDGDQWTSWLTKYREMILAL